MIIKKYYDEKEKADEVWYDSSMIYYTKFVEHENENRGDLFVTFKNGTLYVYKSVAYGDYLVFKNGGTSASSQGKALNSIIKPMYDFENLGDSDMDEIKKRYNEICELENKENEKQDYKNITYFISGHRAITNEEFEFNYVPLLELALNNTPNARFVVGDYYGVDIMAQNYLVDVLNVDPDRITVYHMFESPRNINPKIKNTVGGFQNDDDRDAAMTENSFEDIALVRDENVLSGTVKNILRRYKLKIS
jgi:hypothetical protein